MAHNHHGAHDALGMDMEMESMCMYFYQSIKVHFIFENFDTTTGSAYFGALATAFLIGFSTEAFSVLQNSQDQRI